MEKTDISSMDMEELQNYMELLGEKPFRARQVYQWIHEKLADRFEQMSSLPARLRQTLDEQCFLSGMKTVDVQVSRLDGTRKYLFELGDGNVIESVLMHYHHGNSVCISSQAGCRMGCRFCASTIGGLKRNLTASEMLG